MADPYQYTTLTSSLPYQPALFTEKQTVISRIRLDQRLGMLEEDDAHVLRLVEDLVAWSHQEFERSDEEIVRRARRGMAALPEGVVRDLVLGRLEMRTVGAAFRRRKAGLPIPGPDEVWGHGRWVKHIRNHWAEPDFHLSGVFPWVGEAGRLLAADDTIGLQRLYLTEAWQTLGRAAQEHEFDFEAVVIYVLRWSITDRWTRYDARGAIERFEELLNQGLGDAAGLGVLS